MAGPVIHAEPMQQTLEVWMQRRGVDARHKAGDDDPGGARLMIRHRI
jgi:hypothetical protein